MRLCPPVSLCLAAAAALLPAPAHAEAGPSCSGPEAGGFPLTTRLHGGPDSYRAGGGYGIWYLDLTNTTRRTCTEIHPVVVLVDAERALKPTQPRLEFYADGLPHPVRFEPTDDDELVGAFTDDDVDDHASDHPDAGTDAEPDDLPPFPGFTVGPGRTLTVKLRLALTSDTAPNAVTANAAVVQRHGDDGDWIGQSNDYRFAVETDPHPDPDPDPDPDPEPDPAPADSAPAASDSAAVENPTAPLTPTPTPSATETGRLSLAEEAEELAMTGLSSPAALIAGTVCLLAAGAAVLLARRRR
ncbi:LPXTG cell wall anchor domain-containing protein [Streptomyces sp. NPDC000618]|uniref:LPXTG cell wall anchor domain-containing protein n=1 Tax=Streptomyces sp. NPDC000618 TaxID=3154265 RepID=UPI0033280ACF